MKNKVSVLILIGSLLSGISSAQAEVNSYGFGVGDLNVSAVYALAPCATETDLDCIESVGFVNESGVFEKATFNRYGGAYNQIDDRDKVTKRYEGHTIWSYEGREILINAKLESPKTIIRPDDETYSKWGKYTGSSLRVLPQYDDMKNQKIRFAIRTSWLRPSNVQVKATYSKFDQKRIPSGNLFTIEGKGIQLSDWNIDENDPIKWGKIFKEKMDTNAKADREDITFQTYIHHAGKSTDDSYFTPVCAEKGYSVQSHNTNATGDPVWTGESLEFAIQAPHFRSTGELNEGYFWFKASHAYLDCKFPGNFLTTSPKVEVQIIDETGVQQIATTMVDNSNGFLTVEAIGFHFSSPTIKVVPVPEKKLISTSKATIKTKNSGKQVTISCTKGRVTKKITGTNPKCPAGYKKK